jgi:hypothetical protein
MSKKIRLSLICLCVFGAVISSFIAGWTLNEKKMMSEVIRYYAIQIDSLARTTCIREDEELPYYNERAEIVFKKLPNQNTFQGKGVPFFDNGKLDNVSWIYRPYVSRVKDTNDTLWLEVYQWTLPYSDRPNLLIIFEKTEKGWIATNCVQWDPKVVQF